MRIALNGYGRVAQRLIERMADNPLLQLVAINHDSELDPGLLRDQPTSRDGHAGPWSLCSQGTLHWRGEPVRLTQTTQPEELDWQAVEADVVVDSSRIFSRRHLEAQHQHGRIVMLMTGDLTDSQPDATLVPGLTERDYRPHMAIVSAGSDRTQAVCPMLSLLVRYFAIESYRMAVHRPPYDWAPPRIVEQLHQSQQIGRIIPVLHRKGQVVRIDDPGASHVTIWLDITTQAEVPLPLLIQDLREGVAEFPRSICLSSSPPPIAGCRYSAVVDENRLQVRDKQIWMQIQCDPVISYVERLVEILQFLQQAQG